MERIADHAEDLRRFVAQRVANPSDAEDIAQQTLLIACEKLATFRDGNLKAWLFTIARNLVVDHYRARNRFQFFEVDSVNNAERESALKTGAEDVQNLCDSRDQLRCYLCITNSLRLEHQVAVLLSDLLGYRDKDSAEQMGVSLASFKLLLHHARAHLQRASGGSCSLVERDPQQGPASERCGCSRVCNNNCASASRSTCDTACCGSQPAECATGQRNPVACSGRDVGVRVCEMGVRCLRLVPNFRALRDRLLTELHTSLLSRALLALTMTGYLPEMCL